MSTFVSVLRVKLLSPRSSQILQSLPVCVVEKCPLALALSAAERVMRLSAGGCTPAAPGVCVALLGRSGSSVAAKAVVSKVTAANRQSRKGRREQERKKWGRDAITPYCGLPPRMARELLAVSQLTILDL